MASVEVDTRTLSHLQHQMRKVSDEIRATVVDEIQDTGIRIRDRAKQLAPVETGELRDAIKKRSENKGLNAKVSVVGAGGRGRMFYARFIEFGTKGHTIKPKRKEAMHSGEASSLRGGGAIDGFGPVSGDIAHPGQPPRPFLFPAYEQERGGFEGRLRAAVRATIRRTTR